MLDTYKQNLNLQSHSELIIGLSGGLDSVVALYLASKLDVPVTAVYVDHGLSTNSNKWMLHCAQLCHEMDVRFVAEKVTLSSELGNVEMQARVKRYQVLEGYVDTPNKVLVTGHHRDDLAETFLLAMKRGSGVDGLASMPFSKPFGEGSHRRPLLSFSKKELMLFASSRSLTWVEDESNEDNKYDRNFLRNTVIPLLDSRWESVSKSIARSAELCAANRKVMEELLSEKLELVVHKGVFDLDKLLSESPSKELVFEMVRQWLRTQGIVQMPSLKKMNEFWSVFTNAKSGASPVIRLSDTKNLRLYKGCLHVVSSKLNLKEATDILCRLFEVEPSEQLLIADVEREIRRDNSYDFLPTQSSYAIAYGGDGVKISRNGYKAPMNDHLHIHGVPPWLRQFVPRVYIDDKLVYVGVVGFVAVRG